MTKEKYMALADFQTLWTDKIKPKIPEIAGTADVSGKANKLPMTGQDAATENNFMSISASGDIKDSGKKAGDFAAANHNHDSAYAAKSHNHDGTYAPVSHTHTTSAISDFAHSHTKSDISDFAHNHDDRYYTEQEVDDKIADCARKYMVTVDAHKAIFSGSPATVNGHKAILIL